jgi:hypothetical protein
MTTTTDIEALMALETQRCRLISEKDYAGLADMLADELVHVHANGLTQDKPTYLSHVSQRPRRTERRDLRIQVHGDAAVMTGRQVNLSEGAAPATGPEAELAVMQVWVRRGETWKLAAFQATRVS